MRSQRKNVSHKEYNILYDRKDFDRFTRTGEREEGSLIDDIHSFELHQALGDHLLYEITYPEGNIQLSLKDKQSKEIIIDQLLKLDDVVAMKDSESVVIHAKDKTKSRFSITCVKSDSKNSAGNGPAAVNNQAPTVPKENPTARDSSPPSKSKRK